MDNQATLQQLQECDRLIANGQTEKALQLAIHHAKGKFRRRFIALSNRHKNLTRQNNIGTVTTEQYQAGLAKISTSLLATLQEYESALLTGNSSTDLKERAMRFVSNINKLETDKIAMSPFVFGLLTFTSFVSGLLWEYIPQQIPDYLQGILGKYYTPVWIVLVLLFLTLTVVLNYWERHKRTKAVQVQTQLTNAQRNTFIEHLKERYTSRLEQKLDNRFSLDLEFSYTLEGVRESRLLRLDKEARKEEDTRAQLAELAQKHAFLLILGNPGSGKTSSLLDLALGMLQKIEDAQSPIPVIFNLAGWTDKTTSFDQWLIDALIAHYNYPEQLAIDAIDKNQIIPLLDGFDEVGMHLSSDQDKNAYRKKCLAAIQNYQNRKNSPKQFVICSRLDEYKQANGNAPVDAQIVVKEVTSRQVKKSLEMVDWNSGELYKEANKNAASNILTLVAENPTLQRVLRSPFYFNAAIQVLNQGEDHRMTIPDTEAEIKHFLSELYIRRKLEQGEQKYTSPDAEKYLNWLSKWLQARQNISFELADFQPSPIVKRWKYGVTYGSISGLACGLVGGVDSGLINGKGWVEGLTFGLVAGLIVGLVGALIGGVYVYTTGIQTEKRILKRETLIQLKTWKKVLVYSLIMALLTGFLFGLLFGFFGSLVGGLTFGLPFGFVLGLIISVRAYTTEISHFSSIDKPYRRFANYTKWQITVITLSTLIIGFPFMYFYMDATFATSLIRSIGVSILFGSLSFFLSPLFQHLVLNYWLKIQQNLPFPMTHFFNHCTELRILERDGGSWRFRHQIIQDFFAENGMMNALSSSQSA